MKKIILKLVCLAILFLCTTNLSAQTGDADGDGVLDSDDVCPTTFGTKSNKGCPDENKVKTITNKSLGFAFSFDKNGNFAVDFVLEKSPAQLAGMQVGDILIDFNDSPLLGKEKIEVLELIKSLPDNNVKIDFQRSGIKQEITLNKADKSSFTNICLSGNCGNGKGSFQDTIGNKYVGDFKNGNKSGNGKMYYVSGNSYDGSWVNNKINGKGKFTFKNGAEYNGEFKNDTYEGNGEFKRVNGETYKGSWVSGKKSGYGKQTLTNGNNYEGDFLNDKMNGRGTYKFASGEIYTGDFKNDKYEGYGELKYADGTLKKGMWVANVFQDDAIAKSSTNTPNQISREQFNTDAKKYSGSTGDDVAAVKKNSEELNKSNKKIQQDSKNKTKEQDNTDLFTKEDMDEFYKQNPNVGKTDVKLKEIVVDKYLADKVLLPYYDKVSRLYGYINENGAVRISARFNLAFPFDNKIAIVYSNKSYPPKYAFINKSGNMLTDFKYADIAPFDKNGYAEVKIKDEYGKLSGLVNKNGEEVLECKFSNLSEDSKVANQYIIESTAGDKVVRQIYNIETKITYAPKYERVFSYTNDNLWAKQNNKWFLVNKQGNKINNNEYDDIEKFYGESELYTVIRNEKRGFVNVEGKEIIPLVYKKGRDMGIDIYAATDDNGTTTVFDKKGKQIFQIAGNIGYYSDGLAVVYNTDNLVGKMYRITGFVDTKGVKIKQESISFFESKLKEVGYKSIYDIKFENGVCPMFKNNKWGIVDKAGNQIVPSEYDDFNIENGDLIIMSKGKIGIGKEQYFLFDRKGKKLFEFDCRFISVDKNFYTISKQNGESGVINGKGKMIIPFTKDASINFEEVGNFAKKLFWINKEDESYLIDETGKEYKAK